MEHAWWLQHSTSHFAATDEEACVFPEPLVPGLASEPSQRLRLRRDELVLLVSIHDSVHGTIGCSQKSVPMSRGTDRRNGLAAACQRAKLR